MISGKQINPATFIKTASLAALLAALVFRRNLDAEVSLLRSSGLLPPTFGLAPAQPADWLNLFRQNPLLAMVYSNFFDMVNYLLVAVIFTALILILFENRKSTAMAAGLLTALAVIGYTWTNQTIHLLFLSRGYAGAVSAGQSGAILGEANAALRFQGLNAFEGGGLYPSYFLIMAAGLILSALMLKAPAFSRSAALVGLLANGIGLVYYPVLAFFPAMIFLPVSISAVFLFAWYLMLSRQLWTFSRKVPASSPVVENRHHPMPLNSVS